MLYSNDQQVSDIEIYGQIITDFEEENQDVQYKVISIREGTELLLSASVNKKIETSLHKPQVTDDILKFCAHVFLIVNIDLIYIS